MVGRAFTAALVRARRPAEDDGIRVRLTPREDQVARAVAAGLTDQQIAQELGVTLPCAVMYGASMTSCRSATGPS